MRSASDMKKFMLTKLLRVWLVSAIVDIGISVIYKHSYSFRSYSYICFCYFDKIITLLLIQGLMLNVALVVSVVDTNFSQFLSPALFVFHYISCQPKCLQYQNGFFFPCINRVNYSRELFTKVRGGPLWVEAIQTVFGYFIGFFPQSNIYNALEDSAEGLVPYLSMCKQTCEPCFFYEN